MEIYADFDIGVARIDIITSCQAMPRMADLLLTG